MQTFTTDQIAYGHVMGLRKWRAAARACRAFLENDGTLAGERATAASLLAAVQDYITWLDQDTRPDTAPSWTLVGDDPEDDGHIVGPLDDYNG